MNRINLIVLLIVFGAPVLQWVIMKLREHAEETRKKREFEQRHNEALRTGQAPPVRVDPREAMKARQAAIAAARQEKLRELRRRAIEQAEARRRGATRTTAQTGTTTRQQAPRPAPTPARPTQISRKAPDLIRSGQAEADRINASRQRQIEDLRRRQREQAKRAQGRPQPVAAPAPEALLKSVFETRAPTAAPIVESPPPARQTAAWLKASDVRRGVIMAEILAPPIALRTGDPLRYF